MLLGCQEDTQSLFKMVISMLAWHVVHGVSGLVERYDVVEPSSGLTRIHVVIASNLASRVQWVVLDGVKWRWSSSSAGHWRHWRTCWTRLDVKVKLKL